MKLWVARNSVIHPNCYRKATVEEIIEHFKKI